MGCTASSDSHGASSAQAHTVKKELRTGKLVFVLGGPASGKGTQCANLVKMGWTHISTGDLMREEIAKGTKNGLEVKRIVDQGGLVPPELTCNILINAMAKAPKKDHCIRYLIDGFPRAIAQAEIFEKMIGEPDCVLYFNTPESVCVSRCLERAKSSGRSDDTEEIIAKRLKTYNDASKPVVDFYALKGRVREVDGSGSPDAVWNLTQATKIHRASAMAQALKDQLAKAKLVFVLGGPGSGKRTQCGKMAQNGWTHICTSELVRAEISNGSQYGALIKKHVDAGTNVPAWLICRVIGKAIIDRPSDKYMVDGFPREFSQVDTFYKLGRDADAVVYFNAPEAVLTERALKRGAAGDTKEMLAKRISTYNAGCKSVIQMYKEHKKLHEINSNQDSEKVWAAFQALKL